MDSGIHNLVHSVEDKCEPLPVGMKIIDPILLEIHKCLVWLKVFIKTKMIKMYARPEGQLLPLNQLKLLGYLSF